SIGPGRRPFGRNGCTRRRPCRRSPPVERTRAAHAKHGATIAWLRQMCFCMEVSLRELEKHLMVRPLLDNVSILRANFIFAVSEQSIQMVRLSQRYGFEPISAPPPLSMLQRAYQLGENVLISLMARASSAQSLERGTLRRDRTQVFLPRRLLARRYRES